MSLPAESMSLGSSCLARQRSARQAEATPGRTSRRVASARQDEKGVPWFWRILYVDTLSVLWINALQLLNSFSNSLIRRHVFSHNSTRFNRTFYVSIQHGIFVICRIYQDLNIKANMHTRKRMAILNNWVGYMPTLRAPIWKIYLMKDSTNPTRLPILKGRSADA